MRRFALASLLLLASIPGLASAQRRTGVIGAYVPPRDWPQEPRRFDLLHQSISIRFDVPHRALYGSVTTRVVITQGATDTIRLNAENLTIDRAADAGNKTLRFTADTAHVTVRLAKRAQTGDTVQFTLTYHGIPERGLYFVPRRNVVCPRERPPRPAPGSPPTTPPTTRPPGSSSSRSTAPRRSFPTAASSASPTRPVARESGTGRRESRPRPISIRWWSAPSPS